MRTGFCNAWLFLSLGFAICFFKEQLELPGFNEMMLRPGRAGMGRCLGFGKPLLPLVPTTTFFLNTAFYKQLNC